MTMKLVNDMSFEGKVSFVVKDLNSFSNSSKEMSSPSNSSKEILTSSFVMNSLSLHKKKKFA